MNLSDQDELLLNAYVDGELSAIDAHGLEKRIAAEPPLGALLDARRALRMALRADLAEDLPSENLRHQIVKLNLRASRPLRSWQSLAASFVLGTLLAGGLAWGVVEQKHGEEMADQVVSAHIRGLMAPAPTDVPSSERHTVKPWFNGKIDFAPVVADFAEEGFALIGARIDVVGLSPAATLVYRHGKHLISLTEMPSAQALALPVTQHRERGYLAFSWRDGRMAYWAVSDAAPEELERFVKLFQAAATSS